MKNCSYKLLNIILLSVVILYCSCSEKTDKDKMTELVIKYAKENIPDYESFEIIEISNWDSTYTKITEEYAINEYAQSYDNVISCINASEKEIQRIQNYLEEIAPYIEQAQANETEAFFGMNEHLGYNQYGNERRGFTMRGLNNYSRAKKELEKLKRYQSDALSMKRKEENNLQALIEQEQTIKNEVRMFCSNWKRKYLGKSTLLKCRFKNNEGNMNVSVYDILCNDSLSQIISIKDTTNRQSFTNLKQFILYCHN